ncbi:sodium-coupled neutral amino acid transporter 9 homolog [Leptidea sinapis]|uniref:sodium-coupled neutral amino acid transporter 9 homolog n=1 Tax=Leptidea sinapis TaxID=189913 RepID=UPI0021C3CB8E|nr:sodium-coupled neutral amino acid transporter 9 homolog [Leptidea sinapis]
MTKAVLATMRSKRNNSKSGCESAASSVQSGGSYGVFGACSDFSECEYNEDGSFFKYEQIPSGSTSNASFHSTKDRETTPLICQHLTPTYRAISHGSSSDTLGPGDLSDTDIIATYKRTLAKSKPERKKQSSLITIFSIWNTIMGSSLLTMAWGVERAGLPAALVLMMFMAALCLYTAYLLIIVNRYHGGDSCEVPALCRTLLGPAAAVVAHAFSLMVLTGANVLYWVLITNFLYYTVNYFIDQPSINGTTYNSTVLCPQEIIGSLTESPYPSSPYWGLHTTVPIYVAILVFPLLNFKNVSFFTKFNSLGKLQLLLIIFF